jgi:oxygen-independent coproporphyrinogen-3 oxidase
LHAVKLAKQQGFNNINADLIIGLPTQKLKHVKKDVKKLTKLGLTHLSVYDLILEENTPFSNKVKSGKLQPLSEKLTLKMQDYVVKKLNKRKYMRYEVSAYSKKGYKSAHNLKYWQGKDYLGLGLSSHSKISDTRFFNTSNLNTYINNVTNNGELKYENKHILTKKEKQEEYIMLGLRKTEGINIKEYNKLFKKDLLNDKQKKIEMLLIKGLIKFRNDQLQLTNKGFNVLNNIILQLI